MDSAAQGTDKPTTNLIVILVAIAALNAVASTVVIPALPSIKSDLLTDLATVQLVLSGYLVATAIGQLFVGPVSDRMGRRPVLFAGLAVFILAGFAGALAPSINLLVAMCIVQGLGGCVGIVISRAVLRDVFERDRAASALVWRDNLDERSATIRMRIGVTMGMIVAALFATRKPLF